MSFKIINEPIETAQIRDNGSMSTMMGFIPTYDGQGRPTNTDPNSVTTSYTNVTSGKRYSRIKKGWVTRWFEGDVSHGGFDSGRHFEEEDMTPSYLR